MTEAAKREQPQRGKKIEPKLEPFQITLDMEQTDVVGALECGFHVGWIEGSTETPDGEAKLSLSCGAGVGSPMLQVSVKMPDGSTRYARTDIRGALTGIVEHLIANELEGEK